MRNSSSRSDYPRLHDYSMNISMRHLLVLCSATIIMVWGPVVSAGESDGSRELKNIFNEFHEFVLREYPESATFNGDHRYDSLCTEYNEGAYQRRLHKVSEFRQRAEQVDTRELTQEDLLNRSLFVRNTSEWAESMQSEEYLIPLNQMNGLHLDMQLLADQTRLESDADKAGYVSRLRAFPVQVNDLIALMRKGMSRKLVPPEIITRKILAQLESIVATPFDRSPLCTKALRIRTKEAPPVGQVEIAPSTLVESTGFEQKNSAQKSAFEVDVLKAGRGIAEAYAKLHEFVKTEYLPASRKTIGYSSLPNGARRYASRLLQHITVSLSPDEVFNVGMKEVERIKSAMDLLKLRMGHKESLEDFNAHLRVAPEYFYTNPEQLLFGFDSLLMEAKRRIIPLFERLPRADCQIKELESFRAESAPQAYYNSPPEDGSKPGYFYVNTYNLPSRPIYTMTALTLHEAVPGHHLQIALAQEMPEQPWFRRQLGTTAFVEGWALYAERLGYEMGMYTDPLQEYGALGFEMWRAGRLVVDVGIHMKNWTREQAVDFMRKNIPNSEVDIANEIDRYIADPGQACAYKIGQLTILRLRAEAEKVLGNRFKLERFHDIVLRNGAIPLELLEENVRSWIRREADQKN